MAAANDNTRELSADRSPLNHDLTKAQCPFDEPPACRNHEERRLHATLEPVLVAALVLGAVSLVATVTIALP